MSKINVSFGLLMAFVLRCCRFPALPHPADFAGATAQLIQAAKSEGTIVSYGLPNSWVNYGGLLQGFTKEYGITHKDTDMDSGTIISTLIAEASSPVADTTDLGLAFAKAGGRQRPFKTLHEFLLGRDPRLCQGPEGSLVRRFYGVMGFLVNADKVKNVPKTWEDLLKAEYKGTMCMKNPRSSATAQMIVLGAAFAHGGSETNVQPGLGFLQEDDRSRYSQWRLALFRQHPEGRVPDYDPVGLRCAAQQGSKSEHEPAGGHPFGWHGGRVVHSVRHGRRIRTPMPPNS